MVERTLYGYRLRDRQMEVAGYAGGRMAVSAIPGSGKTLTLALLAARLVIEGRVGDEGEVLVVTVQNSAVDNIAGRIRDVLAAQRLPPVGYHVCTLHKLAADIVRTRRDLAGVEDAFSIVDETVSRRLMHQAAEVWIAEHRGRWQSYLPDETGRRRAETEEHWRDLTERVGREVAKLCKHLRKTPEQAQKALDAAAFALDTESGSALDFARMGLGLYGLYQTYLQAWGGLDFDDLIWQAVEALNQDVTFEENLRERWPYILEDEAQDSSPLQEEILNRLSGGAGNWVRVGDPNQAINSTFTAADPAYFKRFLLQPEVTAVTLDQSGRSGQPIIALANRLVAWACQEHPEPAVRASAFKLQAIRATDAQDAQRNPPASECRAVFRQTPFVDAKAQAERVAEWAADYIRRYPERSVAVLCPANYQGLAVVEALQGRAEPVPFDDLLRSTPQVRDVARTLAAAVAFLADPTSGRRLAGLHGALERGGLLGQPFDEARRRRLGTVIRSVETEKLLFPAPGEDLASQPSLAPDLEALMPGRLTVPEEDRPSLLALARLAGRWVRALGLPVDQLILTIAQDLFADVTELAICQGIALSLGSAEQTHPAWRLPDHLSDLQDIARNRRGLGLSLLDVGYAPKPGHVAVTTMHKAKGLEWDAVYLLSVDTLEFPDTVEDAFRDEPYYMEGRAPAVEARKLLERALGSDAGTGDLVEAARIETISERLRLLYVGITRAKRNLAVTWCETNGGRRMRRPLAVRLLAGDLEEIS